MQGSKARKLKYLILVVVFILLTASIFYGVYMYFKVPDGSSKHEGVRLKSDYLQMIGQSVLGMLMIYIPKKVEDRMEIDVPNIMEILYIIFLFSAIYLGEIQHFYSRFPFWDTLLHFFSACMLSAVGFQMVNFLTGIKKFNLRLNPLFVSIFAFCFSVTAGALWEVFEFSGDGLMGSNMQKFMTYKGETLIGREALRDTMEDIIVDILGSLAIAIIGYFYLRHHRKIENSQEVELE